MDPFRENMAAGSIAPSKYWRFEVIRMLPAGKAATSRRSVLA
jgi:hypothetical protein